MTREVREQSGRNFHKSYPLPENQLDFGIALQGDMEVLFPDHAVLLEDAIKTLGQVIGIGVPKYKIVLDDAAEAQRAGHAEENGYAKIGRTIFSKLQIAPAKKLTEKEMRAMSSGQRAIYETIQYGTVVNGKIQPGTRYLMESLYRLTGANVLRDDLSAGYSEGSVVRQGLYMGDTVFFEESFDDTPCSYTDGTSSLFILDAQTGQDALDALNIAQLREFCELAGVERYRARQMEFAGEITAGNYRTIGAVLQAARHIVDTPGVSQETTIDFY